jgi:hypothetical protein
LAALFTALVASAGALVWGHWLSLINKMLKDLEARQGAASPQPAGRPIFQDLLSVNRDRRRVGGLVIGVLAAVALAAAGYYGATHWGNRSTQTTATTLPMVVETPVSPAVDTVAMMSTSAPAPVVIPPATVTAAPPPKPPAPAKPAAARAPVTKPATAKTKTAKTEATPNTGAQFERTERPYSAEELAENAYRDAAQLRAQGTPAEAERRLKTLWPPIPSR